ncbi:MAG: hypothetical protein ACTHK2_08240 [Dokdonella sp.]|uniref:hypothetical protein n=1 Tax=Dokdonella sp. TaxID=2291710 RepID=UPI003F7D0748
MNTTDRFRRSAAAALVACAAFVGAVPVIAGTPAVLTITIDDAHDFARFGGSLDYTVTVANTGGGDALDVTITNMFPEQLDPAFTTWLCLPSGVGTTCTENGTGPLDETGLSIPQGNSITWLVHAPVRIDASGEVLDNTVSATWGGNTVCATDSDALVIFREGFDTPYGDGS